MVVRFQPVATTAFKFQGDSRFARSHTAGNAVYLRSNAAADDGAAVVYGVETTSSDLEAVSLTTETSGGLIERATSSVDFDSITHVALPASHAGTFKIYSDDGTAATGDIRIDTNPSDGDTVTIGLTGFTQAYTFKNTPASAYDVDIGATAADTADNLAYAINDSGGVEGTDYGSGTDANPYVSASSATGTVTLTDRITCSRSLAWSITESSTNTTIRLPSGGADGTLLATVATGTDAVSNASGLLFDDPAATTDTFPATLTGASSSIQVRGPCTIWLKVGTIPGGDVALKFQTSHDDTNWRDGDDSISNFGTDADQKIEISEHVEYIRLNVTSNTLTGGTPVDARVVY